LLPHFSKIYLLIISLNKWTGQCWPIKYTTLSYKKATHCPAVATQNEHCPCHSTSPRFKRPYVNITMKTEEQEPRLVS